MKLTVYTAIFGNYDVLKEPLYTSDNIKYVCFTDKPYESNIWDVRVSEITEINTRREARKHKILSHKYIDTEISIWIDGSRCISVDPIPYVKRALKTCDIIAGIHPSRDCIYDEARKCIKVGKGNHELISEQMLRYLADGYPENNGLINSTVMIRRLTPEIIKLENDWWDELNNGCERDQVSFNYVIWKNNLSYGIINWKKFVKAGGHKRK